HCYLCDMCFMTKCPYVPPHPWNVDFPHLMLRAKAVRARTAGVPWRGRALAATDTVGRLAGIPVVAQLVNAVNRTAAGRALLEKTLGVDRTAPLPQYHARSARRRLAALGTTARAGAASAARSEERRVGKRVWSPGGAAPVEREMKEEIANHIKKKLPNRADDK